MQKRGTVYSIKQELHVAYALCKFSPYLFYASDRLFSVLYRLLYRGKTMSDDSYLQGSQMLINFIEQTQHHFCALHRLQSSLPLQGIFSHWFYHCRPGFPAHKTRRYSCDKSHKTLQKMCTFRDKKHGKKFRYFRILPKIPTGLIPAGQRNATETHYYLHFHLCACRLRSKLF